MDKAYLLANTAKPSERQIKWQETEFYGLVSYGLPVFTGKQYGDGFTSPAMFWPEDMDTDSWCDVAKKAGMKGLVFTCKHYDGFCLWPTQYTDYSVKNSNWMNGGGDMVRLVSDSCRRCGLKFGIYLAPWDRHEKTYGKGRAYDDFFCGLLTELLTDYGDVFCVWLDGICGSDEAHVQNYDWARYYKLIRELAPGAVISFSGPDVRWCGNEKGVTRAEEWSPLPAWTGVYEDGTSAPAPKKHADAYMQLDLGSRRAIKGEKDFIWYPCEVSLPMRAHWFFDEEDKYSVKTKDKLLKLYYNTVGNNSCLMLGLSPNKRGVLDDTDTQILNAFGYDLRVMFGANLLCGAKISASSNNAAAGSVVTRAMSEYWSPDAADKKPELVFELGEDDVFDKLVLCENIADGQRVEGFEVFILNEKGKWKSICEGTSVGYKRICPLKPAKARAVKIVFTEYRDTVEISHIILN